MKQEISRAPGLAVAMSLALMAGPAFAQTATEAPPAVDPETIAIIKQMGDALRALPAFSVDADLIWEEVMEDGQKITVMENVAIDAQPPTRLRVEQTTPARKRIFYFNGEQATLWAPGIRYYTQVDFKGTIAGMIAEAASKYDYEIPLSDLFFWGADDKDIEAITAAQHVGLASIDGRICDQYALRQEGADWQIWIEDADPPLPCAYSIVDLTDDARPTFNAVVRITSALEFSDGRFTFVPPEDALPIPFETVQDPKE